MILYSTTSLLVNDKFNNAISDDQQFRSCKETINFTIEYFKRFRFFAARNFSTREFATEKHLPTKMRPLKFQI